MGSAWANEDFTLVVVSAGVGFTGLFIYSPSPGAGNLIDSITAQAGTDPYGNAYKKGDTTYANDGFGSFIQNIGGVLIFGNTTFPTSAAGATSINLQTGGAGLFLGGPGANRAGFSLNQTGHVQLVTNSDIIAANPGTGLEETWHTVGAGGQPPFLNSFSAGGTAPRFQLEPIGGTGRVRLSGAVNTGAVTAANTAMFNLPAGYRPSRTLQFVTPNNVTAYALGGTSVQVISTGDVQLGPAGTAGKFVVLDGICFELD